MDTCNFYYEKLEHTSKCLYRGLEDKFRNFSTFPIQPSTRLERQKVEETYFALYLDKCLIQMPPPHFLVFRIEGNCVTSISLSSQAVRPATRNEIFQCEDTISDWIASYSVDLDSQYRAFLIYITRRLFENAVYRLTRNGFGESARDVLLYHSGYCTGFARTVKYICDRVQIPCVCVRGTIKKGYAAFRNPDDVNKDLPHMWNAVYDKSKNEWIFFDPTSCISIANKQISMEMAEGFFRDSYAKGEFHRIDFFKLPALLRKYTLNDKEFFL